MTTTTTLSHKGLVRETEKAVFLDMDITFYSFAQDETIERTWKVCLPKSQITLGENTVTLPTWLCGAKTRETLRPEIAEYFPAIDRGTVLFVQA